MQEYYNGNYYEECYEMVTNYNKQNEMKSMPENTIEKNMANNMLNSNNNMKKHAMPSQPDSVYPVMQSIAMAYIPYQMWEKPYDEAVAMSRGTMFPSLDKPFIGEEAVNNNG